MDTTTFKDLTLSRLMLGTVQFGLPYGVANTHGQPTYDEVREIVACAVDGGVTCFDTAAMYGESEAVLGKVFAELGIADRVTVVTKTRHLADDVPTREAEAIIEQSVTDSLRLLRMEALPICLCHREEDFLRYGECLLRLREKGLVRHIGSSIMTPEATAAMIDAGLAEALQVPTHLLDHRYTGGGLFTAARDRQVALFVRSVYFQGLLLMPEETMPAHLAALVLPIRRRLQALAAEASIGWAEFALRYVLSLPGVTCLVIGVDTVEQMRDNLALFARGPLEPSLVQQVAALVPPLPDKLLMPNLWYVKEQW